MVEVQFPRPEYPTNRKMFALFEGRYLPKIMLRPADSAAWQSHHLVMENALPTPSAFFSGKNTISRHNSAVRSAYTSPTVERTHGCVEAVVFLAISLWSGCTKSGVSWRADGQVRVDIPSTVLPPISHVAPRYSLSALTRSGEPWCWARFPIRSSPFEIYEFQLPAATIEGLEH